MQQWRKGEGIMGKQMIPVEFTKLLWKEWEGEGKELFMKLFPLTDCRICYIQRA